MELQFFFFSLFEKRRYTPAKNSLIKKKKVIMIHDFSFYI